MLKSSLVGLLVVLFGGGCSGSSQTSKSDASSDSGVVCPSADTASHCGSWSAVLANPSCGAEVINANPSEFSYQDCGPYHVQRVNHVDTFEVYYYDKTTGDCVAAYSGGGSVGAGGSCLAGPPAGVTAACAPGGAGPSTPTAGICAADGGGGG